jgi:hypothetical protein
MIIIRTFLLFVVSGLLIAASPVRAQKNETKGALKTPDGAPAQVQLEPKEVDKIARYLSDLEKFNGQGNVRGLKRASKVKEQLEDYLDKIRKGGREPLKAVDSWWSVFSSDRYRNYSGRVGRFFNKKWQFMRMGVPIKIVYHLQVPSLYRAKTSSPLVLCLHPRQGKFDGNAYVRQMWSAKAVASIPIVAAADFPKEADENAKWSDRKLLYATMGLVGTQVLPEYNVDWRRWFLDGYGDGAAEAWRLASQYADNFAGVIVRGGLPPDDVRFKDFLNTPFLLVGVPGMEMDPAKADDLAKKLKAAGVDVSVANLSAEPRARQERDAFKEIAPEVVKFLEKARDPYPTKIDWSVKENNTRRCFYVKSVGEIETEAIKDEKAKEIPPSFQVKVDRPNNKLVFTCHRIVGFRVLLNDRILDLDKDVTFEVNGKVVFNGRPERTFNGMYEHVRNSGDWTRIFPWDQAVTVPEEEKADKAAAGKATAAKPGKEKPVGKPEKKADKPKRLDKRRVKKPDPKAGETPVRIPGKKPGQP